MNGDFCYCHVPLTQRLCFTRPCVWHQKLSCGDVCINVLLWGPECIFLLRFL